MGLAAILGALLWVGMAHAQTVPVAPLNNPVTPLPVCTGTINISQTATTDVHTFTYTGHICAVALVSASAQNVGVDEGTGTTCETNGTALIGVSSTAAATPTVALAANSQFTMVSGVPWLPMKNAGDHLCVLQSSSGNVSGTITYVDKPYP